LADDILELQRAFDDAELHADTGRLATLLADDFLAIGERGFQRRYDQAAIVRCVQRSRASWRGEPMTLAVRLSQVWIRQPDGWRLAGIQFSTLDPG
jgi:ketosteroid isomerase-like protein